MNKGLPTLRKNKDIIKETIPQNRIEGLVNANLDNTFKYVSLTFLTEDLKRLDKIIERDEKNRQRNRATNESIVKVNKIKYTEIGKHDTQYVKVIDLDAKDKKWCLMVKCPFCDDNHKYMSDISKFPRIFDLHASCNSDLKYSILLDKKTLLKIEQLQESLK